MSVSVSRLGFIGWAGAVGVGLGDSWMSSGYLGDVWIILSWLNQLS